MSRTIPTNVSTLTRLPIKAVNVANSNNVNLIVTTPHKGEVVILTKQIHYPFLFGAVTKTDREPVDVLDELRKLELDARDFLFKEWLGSLSR